jgi:hypothetical protein
MAMGKIIDRIQREAGVADLLAVLSERLTPTDLQSLLLEVYRRRTSQLKPSTLVTQYAANRFVRPALISPVQLLEWEEAAFSNLPQEFETLALSPVCPLGASSVLAQVDQNWAVATVRNTEVVSDSTNVLALECAIRRRALLRANTRTSEAVHLASSHRLLRAQAYRSPSQVAHFSLFALCSAGRDREQTSFDLEALTVHIRFYLRALRGYLGAGVPLQVFTTCLDQPTRDDDLEMHLHEPLRAEFVDVKFDIDNQRTAGRGYYRNFCFNIYATDRAGKHLELVDGGCVDWMQKYLSNARERLVISGIGNERVCALKETMR